MQTSIAAPIASHIKELNASDLNSTIESEKTLFDFSNKTVRFGDYIKSEQWTIVMLWASDCHVCTVEVHQFVKLHDAYSDKNIRVLGISVEGMKKIEVAQEFISIHNVNFPNLIAETDFITGLYQQYSNQDWLGTPTFLVFSPSGQLMAQRSGMLAPELIVDFIEQHSN